MDTTFHLAAYRGSVGIGGTDVDISAVNDGQLTIANSHFVLPRRARIIYAAGFGVDLSRLLLDTPKMRQIGLPSLVPINITATVPSPVNVVPLVDAQMIVDQVDEIAVKASNTNAAAQTMTALVAFAFDYRPVPAMMISRIRFTSAITAVTGSWTGGTITLQQSIPRGRYAVVGLDVVGTNLLAARLQFAGYGFRPGVIARNSVGAVPHPMFQDRSLGVFGEFDSINIPTIEILAGGASTSQEGYIDLVQVTGAPVQSYGQ